MGIELGNFNKPAGESGEAALARKAAVEAEALLLADAGDPDVAIELGVLPKPTVEPEPRKVTPDGNLISEAVDIVF